MAQNVRVLRLKPGQDLKKELAEFVSKEKIEAGVILTCVGSLKTACLRFAGAKEEAQLAGPFEILALSGMLSPAGLHLHVALSDSEGRAFGGHLIDGNIIHTTAEIAVFIPEDYRFDRQFDERTGFKELTVLDLIHHKI